MNYYIFRFGGEETASQAGELTRLDWQVVTVTLLTSFTRPCIYSLTSSRPALTALTHAVFGQWNNSKQGTHSDLMGACAMLSPFLPVGDLCGPRCSLNGAPGGWAGVSDVWMRSASLYRLQQDSQGGRTSQPASPRHHELIIRCCLKPLPLGMVFKASNTNSQTSSQKEGGGKTKAQNLGIQFQPSAGGWKSGSLTQNLKGIDLKDFKDWKGRNRILLQWLSEASVFAYFYKILLSL